MPDRAFPVPPEPHRTRRRRCAGCGKWIAWTDHAVRFNDLYLHLRCWKRWVVPPPSEK